MKRNVRMLMWVVSLIQILLALAYVVQFPAVTRMWPLEGTTPLSFTFIGSIFAAAAAATIWCLYMREDGALAGIALDYITILLPVTVLLVQIASGRQMYLLSGVVCAAGVVFGIWLLRYALKNPLRDTRPIPRIVYWSFIVFVIALIIAGGALVLQQPNILPWNVTPETGVVFGWMFLGAAAYFAYAVYRPVWANAGGQLAGFLIYDIVLIVPFLQRLPTVAPEVRTNLYIYVAVVTYSGVLAIYYLFVNPATSVLSSRAAR